MTAVEVLTAVLKAGGSIAGDYQQPKLRMVWRDLRPMVEAHREDLRSLVRQSLTLTAAYRTYWDLSETQVRDKAIEGTLRENISRLELQGTPAVSWLTLRTSATAYHLETGVCPFCRERGPLHLLAEQIELELRDGR